MGLDIRIKQRKKLVCPKCGEVVGHTTVAYEDSSGKEWYPILESFGYYVPYDQRTEENDWYGKDMTLTDKQTEELYNYVKHHIGYPKQDILKMIATAVYEHDDVAINADW